MLKVSKSYPEIRVKGQRLLPRSTVGGRLMNAAVSMAASPAPPLAREWSEAMSSATLRKEAFGDIGSLVAALFFRWDDIPGPAWLKSPLSISPGGMAALARGRAIAWRQMGSDTPDVQTPPRCPFLLNVFSALQPRRPVGRIKDRVPLLCDGTRENVGDSCAPPTHQTLQSACLPFQSRVECPQSSILTQVVLNNEEPKDTGSDAGDAADQGGDSDAEDLTVRSQTRPRPPFIPTAECEATPPRHQST